MFEPANRVFWDAIATERPDLVKQFTPWDRIREPASLKALLEAGGAAQVEVFTEAGTHPLVTPEDWWTMCLGGGCRGTIDQLDAEAQERVRDRNLQFLQQQQIQALDVDVLYAISYKEAHLGLKF